MVPRVVRGEVGAPSCTSRRATRPRGGSRINSPRAAACLCHSPGSWPGGLAQMGWRDTIDAAADPGGWGLRASATARIRCRRWPTPDTQAVAVRRVAGAVRADGAVSRVVAPSSPTCVRASRRPSPPRSWHSRPVTSLLPGRGLAAGLAAVGGCVGGGPGSAAAERLCSPDILTEFGLRTLASSPPVLSRRGAPPRQRLAVRLVAGVGRMACERAWSRGAERVRVGVLARTRSQLGRAPRAVRGGASTGRWRRCPHSNRVQAWTIGARWALERHWDGRA